MSLTSTLDLIVHLEQFRNIDIYSRGFYQIQLTCKHPSGLAQPIMIQQRSQDQCLHYLSPPFISQKHMKIRSRVFYISVEEEVVSLNQTYVFRAIMQTQQDQGQQTLQISAQLLFYDIGNTTYSQAQIKEFFRKKLLFDEAASATFKVPRPFSGVNQFVPIVFTQTYSCVINATVHCIIVDHRKNPSSPKPKAVYDEASTVLYSGEDYMELSEKEIDETYNSLVVSLASIHNGIRSMLVKSMKLGKTSIKKFPDPIRLPLTIPLTPKQYQRTNSKILKTNISSVLKNKEKSETLQIIQRELKEVVSQVIEIEHILMVFLKNSSKYLVYYLQRIYNQNMKSRWLENIEGKRLPLSQRLSFNPKFHQTRAHRRRRSEQFKQIEKLDIQDLQVFPEAHNSPIIYQEIYGENTMELWKPQWFSQLTQNLKRGHLFVLVHGMMGTAYDMKFIKDTISLLRPSSLILSSKCNQRNTRGSIDELGEKLAQQIYEYCSRLSTRLHKISFIGHSLGSLIIRAALLRLECLKPMMNSFISLNSPHLGCSNMSSKLIGAGIWVITKLRQSECLKQLMLKDAEDIQDCYLYQLAQVEGLNWFKRVLLIGSTQDQYVPFYSARIEVGDDDPVLVEMASSLIGMLKDTEMIRININFPSVNKNNLIDKKAHVDMLDNRCLLNLLLYRYAEAFVWGIQPQQFSEME